ncbi:MAG TPA: Uma2 family endonuclease [Egibacteraceae bacterium]|nr:Uma2 family endonuclease [Egibacteraceae bacterium]
MNECELRTRPMYRHEYEALGALGFFDDENVELLDGQVVLAAEEGPDHGAVYRRLARILIEAVPAGEGEIGVGNPLSLSDLSSPQPDFMVVPPSDAYRAAHPTTASFVVEVSNASRRVDLGFKAVLYAAAGIPEYWVVDLVRDEIVVHRDPAVKTWKSITRHRDGVVRSLRHPNLAVDVRALLR